MKFIVKALFFLFMCFAIPILANIYPDFGIIIFLVGLVLMVGVLNGGDGKKSSGEVKYKEKRGGVFFNFTSVKNEHHTTVNYVQVNYNVSLNILGVAPGFGKGELRRARKEKLEIVKQERKQIGFFDKDGKIENKNKVERIEQSYKQLLEHMK